MTMVLLASASSRRRDWLLERLRGSGVEVRFSSLLTTEPRPVIGEEVRIQVEQACLSKARAAISEMRSPDIVEIPDFVVVADTLVEDPDDPLVPFGKPRGKSEAASMLLRLSGRRHRVWSSTAILYPPYAKNAEIEILDGWTAGVWTEYSIVEFEELDDDRTVWLIDSESWIGKAGGYDIGDEEGASLVLVEGQKVTVLGFASGAIDHLVRMIS